ncbi:MAG: GTPase [Kineosporiaceae bacterium]
MTGRRRAAPDVQGRIDSLSEALQSGAGRLEPRAMARAGAVLDRTEQRLRLGAERAVVALVGATGSGKSSLFNALAGLEIADVGHRRPTTGKPMACVWGSEGADELLDWLEVPGRHRMERESVLDADREASLHGLVLLDMPDHDSTAVSHRLEVDRLVDMVDLLVWVVDPQKYADDALHVGYLQRMRGHEAVMLVVLNQIDRLDAEEVETCRADLRRLLDADGLQGVRLLTASATRGDGVEKLRSVLAEIVQSHSLVAERVAADLDAAAVDLLDGVAEVEPDGARALAGAGLVPALERAAGIPVVLDAVEADYLRRGRTKVSWPVWRWLRTSARIRPDAVELTAHAIGGPAPMPVQRAQVDLAVREATDHIAAGLPPRWAEAVRSAVRPAGQDLAADIDGALAAVPLPRYAPRWWTVLGVVQALLGVAFLGSFLWLLTVLCAKAADMSLGSPLVPLAVLIAVTVVSFGIEIAGRRAVRDAAGRWRASVAAELRQAVDDVADLRVLTPAVAVLNEHRMTRDGLSGAR